MERFLRSCGSCGILQIEVSESFEWPFIGYKVECARNVEVLTISLILEIDNDSADLMETHSNKYVKPIMAEIYHHMATQGHKEYCNLGPFQNQNYIKNMYIVNDAGFSKRKK